MKFVQATLIGFGHFRHTVIDFKENIHLIYGLNEAGKTTLLHFLEGMLYGFYDPFKKGRRMYPVYERYIPEDGPYKGSLTFEYSGKTLRIERDFANHDVAVFNEVNGKNITSELPYNSDLKHADIAAFIGLPYTLFLNTIRISQTDLTTKESAENELFKRLSNLKKTKTTTFSGDGALKVLKDKKDAIGTKNAPTKPYAKALQKKDALKAEKKRLEATEEALLKTDIEILSAMERAQKIAPELSQLKAALDKDVEVESARRLKPLIKRYADDFADLNVPFQDALTHVSRVKNSVLSAQENMESLIYDTRRVLEKPATYMDAKTLETTLQSLDSAIKTVEASDTEILLVEQKIAYLHETLSHIQLSKPPVKPKLTLKSLLIIPFFMYLFAYVKYLKEKRTHGQKNAYLIKEKARLESLIQGEENTLNSALKTRDTALKDLSALGHDSLDAARAHKETLLEARSTSQRYDDAVRTYEMRQTELNDTLKSFDESFKALHLKTDIKSFKRLLELVELSEKVSAQTGRFELSHLVSLLDAPLKDVDKARLKQLDAEEKATALHLSQLKTEKASHLESLEHYESVVSEFHAVKADIEHFETTLETIKNAEALLLRSIDIIEENFAPALASAIETHLTTLTLGAYKTVKVRKDLQFKVEDKAGSLKSTAHFSTATLDQIHLAIRLGILDVLNLKDFPLLFDDAFMHFDEARLKALLKVLPPLDRQVILLTAHQREDALLKRLKIPFERTDLND